MDRKRQQFTEDKQTCNTTEHGEKYKSLSVRSTCPLLHAKEKDLCRSFTPQFFLKRCTEIINSKTNETTT